MHSPQPAFDPALIRRYDRAGPRYTSYPSADRFHNAFPRERVEFAFASSDASAGLSLYFHVPFCETLCFYCGCHRIPTRRKARGTHYVDLLIAEMKLVAARLVGTRVVRQVHLGGGTPTFLADADLARLMDAVRTLFEVDGDAQCAIEVDPRTVDAARVALLASIGFNRLSLGVQDFDPDVQRAINRLQPEAQTLAVLDAARASGFRSVSVDLIYGLPLQTVARFQRTLERVTACRPDRIALYSYAHLPERFPAQRAIHPATLPDAETRLALLQHSIAHLTEQGYVYIGMDHFARADDDLARALADGTLQRNFQGYSTHGGCETLGFGVSAIGCIADTYLQNTKDLDSYAAAISSGVLPIQRGYELTEEDRRCAYVVQELMCRGRLDALAFRVRFGEAFWAVFGHARPLLEHMAHDGLVDVSATGIEVRPAGRLLIRHVAMAFDNHLMRSTKAVYSKVI